MLHFDRNSAIGGFFGVTNESNRIPLALRCISQRLGLFSKRWEQWVATNAVEPVACIEGVGFLAMKDSMPVTAFGVLDILRDRVGLFKTTYI